MKELTPHEFINQLNKKFEIDKKEKRYPRKAWTFLISKDQKKIYIFERKQYVDAGFIISEKECFNVKKDICSYRLCAYYLSESYYAPGNQIASRIWKPVKYFQEIPSDEFNELLKKAKNEKVML